MRIPHNLLSEDAYTSLVSEYVLRMRGNDFDETLVEDNIKTVKENIERGDILILFSELNQEPFLITKQECLRKFKTIPDVLN